MPNDRPRIRLSPVEIGGWIVYGLIVLALCIATATGHRVAFGFFALFAVAGLATRAHWTAARLGHSQFGFFRCISPELSARAIGCPEFSNSANTPSMSRKALPAALRVSMGCSVALRVTPRSFNAYTMSCRSLILRARRSILVTTSVSPRRKKIEQGRQLGAAGAACAARLVGPDHGAAGGTQRLLLQGKILVAAGNAGISVERHGSGSSR